MINLKCLRNKKKSCDWTYINIDDVVSQWECVLGEILQDSIHMAIGLKVNIALTHDELLIE